MSVTLVTTSPAFGRAGDLPDRLAGLGWTLIRCTADDLSAHLMKTEFLVAGLPAVTTATLAAAPRLRGVLKHGVGLDTIDLDACTARNVPVTNTPGANAVAVAELALAQIFALSRNLIAGHSTITQGGWDRRIGREVEGATLGIIGFGVIGSTLAAKAAALGLRVLACDPFADPAQAAAMGVPLLPMPDLLAQSDHVSLHVFGGPSTAGLIGTAELARMKPGATILNLARGEVLDLDALHAALTAGHLSGAAIDAYTVEPPDRSHPIFASPKVIFSPHAGGDTSGALKRMGHMILDDIATLLAGGRPVRTVNPAAFEARR
ncbi:hydroxyacid dehydrogenase [Rhodobacter sp. Har01]|uniref:NAD(P)-dependent oxidoreductase n=1 Tax=Rhodobacter sp. Har01 TaxID=2883999 RepID=UPI001D06198A|nr:NAD(P)-dependent oxidoreductase [Rhodobacter sp. Har01]MCB6179715.1 hydroxyacid dehydrogenase [Rhodobacter sp. Har01]